MEQTTKHSKRRQGRENMQQYVERPSVMAAGYGAMVGLGSGLALFGVYMHNNPGLNFWHAGSAFLICVSLVPFGYGIGGRVKLDNRLSAYFYEVMDYLVDEIEEHIKRDPEPPEPARTRPLSVKSGDQVKEVLDVTDRHGGFTHGHLQSFAVAVLCRRTGMTKEAITKKTSRKYNPTWPYWQISQPMWAKITGYMVDNKLAGVVSGPTELNGAGYDWLLTYVPENETITLPRPA